MNPVPRGPGVPEWGHKKFMQENNRPTSAKLTTNHKVVAAYTIFLTLLVGLASSERSFSKLKLLKTYL